MADTKRLVIMDAFGTIHVDETKPLTVVPHQGDIWWFAPTCFVVIDVVEEEFGAIVAVGALGSGVVPDLEHPTKPEENLLVLRMVKKASQTTQNQR